MMYYILPTDKDIQHHGVLGMKWGVRRYQPYSVVPRKSGENGKEVGDALKANRRAAKKNVKAAYKNSKKASGYINRYEALESKYSGKKAVKKKEKYEKYKALMKQAAKQTLKAESTIGKEAVEKIIKRQEIKDATLGALGSGAAYTAAATLMLVLTHGTLMPHPVVGAMLVGGSTAKGLTNGDALRKAVDMERGTGKNKSPDMSKTSVQRLVNRAKQTDKWDTGFLDAIQNTKIFYENNKAAMAKEYEKYLKDPQNYYKKERHKLAEYDG